jgi:hypothetical protein
MDGRMYQVGSEGLSTQSNPNQSIHPSNLHGGAGMDGPQKGRFLYNAEEYLPANKALYESKLQTGLKVRGLLCSVSMIMISETGRARVCGG